MATDRLTDSYLPRRIRVLDTAGQVRLMAVPTPSVRDVAEVGYLLAHPDQERTPELLDQALERWLKGTLPVLQRALQHRLLAHLMVIMAALQDRDDSAAPPASTPTASVRKPDWMELVATVAAGTGQPVEDIYQMPVTSFWPLLDEVRQQQSEGLLRAGTAASWPYMKKHDREDLRRALERPTPPAPLYAPDEQVAREKAAFFEALQRDT